MSDEKELQKILYTFGLPDIDVRFLVSRILRLLQTRYFSQRDYAQLLSRASLAVVERAIRVAKREQKEIWKHFYAAEELFEASEAKYEPLKEMWWKLKQYQWALQDPTSQWAAIFDAKSSNPTRHPPTFAQYYQYLRIEEPFHGLFQQLGDLPQDPLTLEQAVTALEHLGSTVDEVSKYKDDIAKRKEKLMRAIEMWRAILLILERMRESLLPDAELVDMTPPEDLGLLKGMAKGGLKEATFEARRRAANYWNSVVG